MVPYRKIAYDKLFDDFLGAVVSPQLAQRILIENPIRLYGFPRPAASSEIRRHAEEVARDAGGFPETS